MGADIEDLVKIVKHGVRLCREGKWQKGLEYLHVVAETPEVRERKEEVEEELPGEFYSYLGYGMARYEKRYVDGLEYCKYSVKVKFYVAENYLLLAKTYMIRRNRSPAIAALDRGLKVDPDHADLWVMRQEMGIRRRPLVWFLPRSHPINRSLGRLRHRLLNRGHAPPPPSQPELARPKDS